MHCEFALGRGRFVVAATNIAAGSVIFKEEAYCVAPSVSNTKAQRCVYCCGDAHNPFGKCNKCGSAYCCEECWSAHSSNHSETGECCAVGFTKIAAKSVPEEDRDTFEMACLVLGRCAAEKKSDRLCRMLTCAENTSFETVGSGMEVASPLQFLNTGVSPDTVFVPSYDHVECLGTNMRETNPEIVDDFSELYYIYVETLQHKKYLQLARSYEHKMPCDVSCETFVAICTAFLCNGFGIWNSVNRQLGVALYPQSSYFNHSCSPNMGRRNVRKSRNIEFFAARNIEKGEPLCISYIDLKLPAVERKRKLRATYSFDCTCIRCDPAADFIVANTVCCSCVPALCCNCISKVMQPLGMGCTYAHAATRSKKRRETRLASKNEFLIV
ncbi:hypothetical protein ABB37_07192 [Leptomonas pyrrhocoris]|uniref:SET domain-containing protein n=1 Tax=Leptomonas pyrrhocoris TaxID=157538 RepID=A0A0M9FWB1_LEPPY|nr:hypothetical protein ABB37_07192 [Leptomonas pyrrhocoris]KPA77303.1 hypothetical protein ABB37_07192 [Leptomonas pyrrhocoris]|eukprot:XP_015655742.1 hypothetical protein ABB37_07192 [Leptomonas pyrrhocoris]